VSDRPERGAGETTAPGDGAGAPSLDPRSHGSLATQPLAIPPGLDATLVLVRHGETEGIRQDRFQGQWDVPLSPLGRRQALLTARRLAQPHRPPHLPVPGGSPLVVAHSPLIRAAETARAIAEAWQALGAPVLLREDAAFLEIGQGVWEGLTHVEVQRRYPEALAGWRRRPAEVWAPGGESLADADGRLRPGLQRLLAELAAEGIPGDPDRRQVPAIPDPPPRHPWAVIVGHDGIFKLLYLCLLGLPLDRFWSFAFELCGISVVEFRAGRPTLRAHNRIEHLAADPAADPAADDSTDDEATAPGGRGDP
jgi:broad specificity phosphatase PhoE